MNISNISVLIVAAILAFTIIAVNRHVLNHERINHSMEYHGCVKLGLTVIDSNNNKYTGWLCPEQEEE